MSLIEYHNDKDLKIEYNPTVNKYSFALNQVGAVAGQTIPVANYTYTDSNSIFFSTSGNDTTGDGSQSTPYRTVLKALNSCTITKVNAVCLDSGVYAEDLTSFSNSYFEKMYAATGQTPTFQARAVDSHSDSNTIYVSQDSGSDATGTGTQANPVATITKAVTLCDGTHQKIGILDSATYTDEAVEFTGNVQGLFAVEGEAPEWQVNRLQDDFSAEFDTLLSPVTFIDTYNAGKKSCITLQNGNFVIIYTQQYGKFLIYDRYGTIVKSETVFETDSDLVSNSCGISASVLNNGNFVIVYSITDVSYRKVYFQIYDEDGNQVKSKTEAASIASSHCDIENGNRSVSTLQNDNFVIVFERSAAQGVYYVIWNESGTTKVSSETLIQSTSSGVAVETLNNGDFATAFNWSGQGGFVIYQPGGTIRKSVTSFESGSVSHISLAVLNSDNFVIAWSVISGAGTYFDIWSEDGNTEVVNKTTVISERTSSVDVIKLGYKFVITYSSITTYDPYYSIYLQDGSSVVSSTSIESSTGAYDVAITTLDSGLEFVIIYTLHPYNYINKFVISEHLFTGVEISIATKIDGLEINGNDSEGLYKLININSANLTIKHCSLLNVTNPNRDNTDAWAIYGDDGIDGDNLLIADCKYGIETADNAVDIKDSVFYRITDAYALDITGSGSGIVVEHCTFFDNYGGLQLQSNGGSEVVKNCIFHDNDIYGINADTSITITYGTITDSVLNVSLGTSALRSNPLFNNEGAIDPDDLDLHLRMVLLGDPVDSPCYLLSDDNRDSGAYDIRLVGSITSWDSFTVEKSTKLEFELQPTGKIKNIGKGGTPDTDVEGWSQSFDLPFAGLLNADLDNILLMLTCGKSLVRIYFDPDTNPNDFVLFKIDYKDLKMSPNMFRLSRTGVQGTSLSFIRGYE